MGDRADHLAALLDPTQEVFARLPAQQALYFFGQTVEHIERHRQVLILFLANAAQVDLHGQAQKRLVATVGPATMGRHQKLFCGINTVIEERHNVDWGLSCQIVTLGASSQRIALAKPRHFRLPVPSQRHNGC